MESDRIILEIKTSRTGEETTEAMVQFLSSLTSLRKRIGFFWKLGIPISLEIALFNQTIHFYITVPQNLKTFMEGQLTAAYPKSLIISSRDFLPEVFEDKDNLSVGQLKLLAGHLYPIRTYHDFKDVDPLSSLLSALSKAQPQDKIVIQYLLYPIGSGWQRAGEKFATDKSIYHVRRLICVILVEFLQSLLILI